MRMSDFRYFGFNEETLRYPLALPELATTVKEDTL